MKAPKTHHPDGRRRLSMRAMKDAAVLRGEKDRTACTQIMRDHPELKNQPWRPLENLSRQATQLSRRKNRS